MFVSSLDSASHKIVKHYANSDLAQIVSVTKSSPRSPALVPNVHFTKTACLLSHWKLFNDLSEEWNGLRRMETGEWPILDKKSSKCRAGLCDWGQWGAFVSGLVWTPCLRSRRPPGVWLIYRPSSSRLKQIKPTATGVTQPRAAPGTLGVFINNSIQWAAEQCMLSRWDEAPVIQQQPGITTATGEYLLPRALVTSGPDIVSWGHDGLTWAWHGPGEGRCQPRGKWGGTVRRGKCLVNIMRATSGQHWAMSAVYSACLIWGVPLPHIEFWGLSVNNDLHYPDTVLTGPGGGHSPCHGQWWHNLIMIWLNNPQFHRPSLSAAHARTRQICARLVGCEGWLGLDGCPLSLSTGHMVSLTPDVSPRPPLTNFTVTDWQCPMSSSTRTAHTYGHSAWILHNISRLSGNIWDHYWRQDNTIPWLRWHVHLSPALRACKHIMVGDRFVTARSQFFSHCNIGSIIGRESCTTMTSRQNW